MDQRRIGASTPTLPRKRGMESTRVDGHSLRAVDAANAQDATGLLLFPRANHFFLVGRHTGLVNRLAWLEPPRGLRPAGSGRTDRLGTLGGCRAPASSCAPRRR